MKNRLLFLLCFLVFYSAGIAPCVADILEDSIGRTAKETIIFIPAKDMQSVLEIEKEGIFVSSKAYNSLYKKAKEEYIKKINEVQVLNDASEFLKQELNISELEIIEDDECALTNLL